MFEAADDALGEHAFALCFEGPEADLVLTAQHPARDPRHVHRRARACCEPREAGAAFVAGHSLGEYSALVAAGALSLADAVRAVRARGTFMQEAVPAGAGRDGRGARARRRAVTRVCARPRRSEVVSPANYNSPEQTVIAGHAAAVERASARLKEAGAKRVVPLLGVARRSTAR